MNGYYAAAYAYKEGMDNPKARAGVLSLGPGVMGGYGGGVSAILPPEFVSETLKENNLITEQGEWVDTPPPGWEGTDLTDTSIQTWREEQDPLPYIPFIASAGEAKHRLEEGKLFSDIAGAIKWLLILSAIGFVAYKVITR